MPANSAILRSIAESNLNPKVAHKVVSAKGTLKNIVANVIATVINEAKETVVATNEKIDLIQEVATVTVNEVIEIIEQKIEMPVVEEPTPVVKVETVTEKSNPIVELAPTVEVDNSTRKKRNAFKKTDHNDS